MKKRSVKILGHATSITLEDEFWSELKRIACARKLSINQLVAEIDETRPENANLSSALRIYILKEVKKEIETRHCERSEAIQI